MQQIVCLSAEPWRTVPTRTQQLMIRLKDAQVLFFEPPGRRWRQPGRQMRPGLTVFTLPPLPEVEPRHALLHRQRWRWLARPILRQMERHRFKEPLLWCTDPEQIHLLELLPHRGVVYDCDRDWFDLPPRWESDLALAADVVFAASPGLADHLSPCNDNIALLPNGVNFPMFSRPSGDLPPELRDLRGPVLGWVGTIDAGLDLAPVAYAAEAHPEWTFVLLGRVRGRPRLDRLADLGNVRLLGRRHPVEVPDYVARFDVCLDLRRQDRSRSDIIPRRIYEYLSTGKPIVTHLYPGQVEAFPDVIYGAHTPAEYCRLCQRALEEAPDWVSPRRRDYGAAAAWSNRSLEVQRILDAIGLF